MTQADAALATTGVPSRADRPGRERGDRDAGGVPTREKILDAALDLFTDQGFDATSMREIAARLHLTKPSIYYHFGSKDEILLALHMRVHELSKEALARLAGQPVTLGTWGTALSELLDQMAAHRRLFLMHERNQAALEKLHRKDHDDEHEDFRERFAHALADPSLSLRDRVRMACSLGAVFGGLFTGGDAFDNVPGAELSSLVREAVRDIVTGPGA